MNGFPQEEIIRKCCSLLDSKYLEKRFFILYDSNAKSSEFTDLIESYI